MRKLTASLVIAAACVLVAPAQAHCPNACSTDWQVYTAAQLGLPSTGPVTNKNLVDAVNKHLGHNSIENLISSGTYFLGRTSSTSGWVYHQADYGFRYTPERITWLPFRYIHNCQADRGNFAAGSWRVRCNHGTATH